MAQKHSSKHVVGFLFNLWRVSPKLTLAMFGTQIIFAILTTAVAPLFVSQLLTHIAEGSATLNTSTWLLVGYASVLFIGDVVSIRVTIALAFLSESKMQAAVSHQVMSHLTAKSLSYHANKMSGGTVSDATKLNGAIERFWDTLIFTAVPIVTTIVSVCIVLSFILWQYAVILALLSIIIIVVIVWGQNRIAPVSRYVAERSSAVTAYFADVISNIAIVKAFAAEKSELQHYRERVALWRGANLKEMKSVVLITGTFGIMMTIMNVCAFIVAILATEYHIASIGITYLVISYTLNVVSQLWGVGSTTRTYIRIIGDAGPMVSALNEPVDLKDPANAQPLIVHSGAIEFKDVTFTYEENETALFNTFSLSIKSGQRVGLVGKSGSGKTSLTRLLLRFSDIEGGAILIDGHNIAEASQSSLRQSIAYVSQEPVLFHRTLRENIAYGKQDASDEEILEAAKKANSLDFIEKLPKGLDTLVGERGVKLSGGQRQRIAIARAILKNAPILLLDEATSALDSESEKLIQDALEKLMKGRTSIVIAHRLSTIAKLDRIIVMENGAIVEDGSHQSLLAKKGTYAKLWNHQSGGFIEED
jgi:ATP-binding cassette subfamily B protein